MKRLLLSYLLLVSLLVACTGDAVDVTSFPTPTPPSTPVANTPEAAATAFLGALQERDYATMFGLLSPASRVANDAERFTSRYESSLQAATVLTVTASPIAMLQEGSQAQTAFELIWQTALVGTLTADMVLPLSLQGDRWEVEWSGDLIWPGMGEDNYLYMERYTPARANIYDRNGLALASEGTIVTVGVVPGQIRDEQQVLAALTLVTGMSPADIQERYAGSPPEWWVSITDVPSQVGVDHSGQGVVREDAEVAVHDLVLDPGAGALRRAPGRGKPGNADGERRERPSPANTQRLFFVALHFPVSLAWTAFRQSRSQ